MLSARAPQAKTVCTRHEKFISTRTFRQSLTGSAKALYTHTLAKDVEGDGGDRILYIVVSIRIKLPYSLFGFPQTCVVFCVESLIVV